MTAWVCCTAVVSPYKTVQAHAQAQQRCAVANDAFLEVYVRRSCKEYTPLSGLVCWHGAARAKCSKLKARRRQAPSAPRTVAACGDTCGCFLVGVCEYTATPTPARLGGNAWVTQEPSTRAPVPRTPVEAGAISGQFRVDSVKPSMQP